MGRIDVSSLAGAKRKFMKTLMFIVNVDWFFLSHRLPLALAAQRAGFDVHIATALTGQREAIERHGITVHPLPMDRRSASPLQALRLVAQIWRLLRQVKPEVVHLVTIKPVLLGGLAARFAKVPRVIAAISGLGFVFMAHGAVASVRRVVVSGLYRLALKRTGVTVIFQNGDDQAMLERNVGLDPRRCVLIRGSGVDLKAWRAQPLPVGSPVVMMAARLLKDKGVVEFVEAARQLRGYEGARFVLVGSTDEGNPTSLQYEQLQAWVQEGIIEWWGPRSDMANVLAQAHVVVLPSYREGLPKGLIEAAACGRAVVTTDVPGCRDAIEPGVTGVLVAVRDAAALAVGVQTLLDDRAQIETMGKAGRDLAERAFDVQEVAERHMALYQAH